MSDDLTTARDFLLHADTHSKPGRMLAAATAHATVDAAETLRRIEALLETADILRDPETMAKIAQSEEDIAAGRTSTLAEVRERLTDTPAPDAPATPQVGEVWEDTTGRVRVKLDHPCSGPTNLRHPWLWHGTVVAIGAPSGWEVGDPVGLIELDQDGWRRVSLAPAPLTEREVTAEAQAQGVEPASDDYAQALDDLTSRALDAEARAERAEAEVERVRPVLATADRFEKGNVSWPVFSATVRAYREATRDA